MPEKLLADVTILGAGSLTRICYYSAGSDEAAPSQPPAAAPALADVEHFRSPEALAKWLVTHSGIGEWSAFCVARTLLADSSPFRLSLSDPVPAGQGDGAWRPMETAPTDGTDVLLHYDGRQPVVAAWFRQGWAPMDLGGNHLCGEPSYWQPLPAPPAPSNAGGAA